MARRHIRPSSRDEGFQKLRTLRCFNEIYERLLAGWSIPELARFVQEDRNEYGHASRVGLIQILQRFRNSIPPAQLMAKRIPEAMHRADAEAQGGVDELKELIEILDMQKIRMAIDHGHEKKINKLMPTMTQEVRVAVEIIGRIADLKMDLGLSTRHLGQVDVDAKIQATVVGKYGKESVRKVIEDPEKRRKVLNVVERVLALPGRTEKATVADAVDADFTETAVPGTEEDDLDELARIEIEDSNDR